MKVEISSPIGFCSGVRKAIAQVKEIRSNFPNRKIYFLGDLVHNQHVVDYFKNENIEIINLDNDIVFNLKMLNNDDIVIFSAHGHKKEYETILQEKGILFFDTTCEKVKVILKKISEFCGEIIYIGKKNHAETEASLSYSNEIYLYDINEKFDFSLLKSENPLVINQSTLSVLELDEIFNDIKRNVKNPIFSDEICGATRIRQEQILNLKNDVDLAIIVGDKSSNNSLKLYELASKNLSRKTIMINSVEELKNLDLSIYKNAVIFSGTSTPMNLILDIEKYMRGI